ncbi:MAG: hypothetical protein LIR50_22000 [Bacillota bacterium]|nr:hypothetical protein [Bacillota bacterium]
MKSMEEQFKIKKEQLKAIEVPEELEESLNNALKSRHRENRNFFIRHKTAASLIIILLIFSIYNFDVLAYYGKKIMGYDKVVYGSLKDLNELGEGQQIGKSYTYKDGSEVILDGVFLDENKLVVLFRTTNEDWKGKTNFNGPTITSLFRVSSFCGGERKYDEIKKENSWIAEFPPPNILDRYLTLSISSKFSLEEGKIKFKIDRSKVIKGEVNQNINKSIEADGIKYNFTSLSASPLSTVIKGNIEAGTKKKLFTEGIDGETRKLVIELYQTYIKDGEEITEKVEGTGCGMSYEDGSIHVNYEFNGLKKNLKQLKLKVLKTEDMKVIDKEIKINSKTNNINIDGVKISDVKIENGDTEITFITDKDITFTAGLMISGNEAKLIKQSSDSMGGGTLIKKTIRYKGNSLDMTLMFKDVSKQKLINQEFILYKAAN